MKKNNMIKVLSNNIMMLKYIYIQCPRHIYITILSALMGSISSVINLYITRYILNTLANQKGNKEQQILVTLMIVALLIYNIVLILINTYITNRLLPKNMQIIHQKMQMELFEKAASVELKCYEDTGFYDKFSMAMQQSDTRALAVLNTFASFLSSLFGIGTMGTLVVSFEPILMGVVLINVLIVFAINTIIIKIQHEYTQKRIPTQREMEYTKRVFYLQNFAQDIRLFPKLKGILLKKFDEAIKINFTLIDKYGKKLTFNSRVQQIFSSIINSGIMIYLAVGVMSKRLLIGDFVTVFSGAQQLTGQISTLFNTMPQMYEHSLYIDNFKEFINYDSLNCNKTGIDVSSIQNIILDNISFKYLGTDKKVLSNVSLKITNGERIAIVGKNGAGKSTLVKLIARLYDPISGEIYINNNMYNKYNIDSLRNNIGIVFQDYKTFAVTVAENILMRETSYSDSDIEIVYASLKFAGLYEKVISLPCGIKTVLTREFNNNGEFFSGGEIQKLALARVYARNCSLIILDEPSSALDPIAEKDMFSSMKHLSKNKCSIMISHRLSSIQDVDRIYVMDNGCIVEYGSHDELLDQRGLYYEMYNKQNENILKIY